jgi:type III secretion system YopN/LcrE/InvE/MxiC family regulator
MAINTPQEVIRSQIATNNSISPVGVEIMANAMGKDVRTNESVQVAPNKSDLTDALEELGMGIASRGKPDIDKMKVRRGAAKDVDALSRIAEYLEELPDLPGEERYHQLVRKMQSFQDMEMGGGGSGSGQITADDLRQMLRDYDGDITHQLYALERLRNDAVAQGAPTAVLEAIDQVRGDFATPENLREIRAGIASSMESHRMADRFGGDAASFRDSYRELLRDPQPRLGAIFDTLRKFSLTESFDEVVGSFLKVAGNDLASTGPSTDPILLGALMTELSKLKNLRTVLKSSEDMVAKLDRTFPPREGSQRPDGLELASRILHFSGMGLPTFNDANALLRGYESEPPEVPVLAVNLLRNQHALLPSTIMPSDQAHEQQSRLLVALSDRTVETEEKAYGG